MNYERLVKALRSIQESHGEQRVEHPATDVYKRQALPSSGCNSVSANGVRYYNCGGGYYQPHFGSNGVYYTCLLYTSRCV